MNTKYENVNMVKTAKSLETLFWYLLAEELHRQKPGVTAEGSVLPAPRSDAVVNFRHVW